jgi:hypothetical protein
MTDENKFFRYLWRFNALVLAGIAVAAAGLLVYGILNPWRPAGIAPAGHFAPVAGGAEKEFTYRLTKDSSYSVGREQVIYLGRWNGAPSVYGLQHMSASYDMTEPAFLGVNALAVSPNSGDSHWLFRGYRRAILSESSISLSERPAEPDTAVAPGTAQTVIAMAMTAVEVDTNKDGRLSEKDRQSLYVYREGMAEAMKLLTGDLIISAQQSGVDRFLVISENGKSGLATTFSIPDFKLIAQKPLPNVSQ